MTAHFEQAVTASFTAGADLSAGQYTFVKLNSAGAVVAVSAITDIPVGVLQNSPAQGQTAEVLVIGGTKVKAGAAIALPAVLGVDASGRAVALVPGTAGATLTQFIVGQADAPAGAANDIISAIVNLASPARAA